MRIGFYRGVPGLVAAIFLACVSSIARAQQSYTIVNDTFIDSGSPGSPYPGGPPGTLNGGSGAIQNGVDIYSYGADGKVKAVTSSYSSSYPFVSATHVLLQLPTSFWTAIGSNNVQSAVVTYWPFNDSLSVADQHDNMELHPLTRAFTTGNGTQSPLVASTSGGATWETYDGNVSDAWTTPGGDFDATNYVLASVTDSTLPPSLKNNPSNPVPFSWNITSLIDNSTTRAELENYGAMIRVVNEGTFPNNPAPPSGENDFVSFLSADAITAGATSNSAYLPAVAVLVPEPASAVSGLLAFSGLLLIRRPRRA